MVPRSTGGSTGVPGSMRKFGGIIHVEHGCVIAEVDDVFPDFGGHVGGVWVGELSEVWRRWRER